MELTNSNSNNIKAVGILREEGDVWERRAPLTPADCHELIKNHNIKFIIQPSEIRCFIDDEYKEVGCEISEDLTKCSLIIGIMAPHKSRILPQKTYMFFNRAKKGNMKKELLDKIIQERVRLIDYLGIKSQVHEDEYKLKQLSSKLRTTSCISFGRLAGIAGTANIFKGIAELLLARKFSTPFIFSRLSHMYSNEEDLKDSFKEMGKFILDQYLPLEISPFVVAVVGTGHVAAGALEVLTCLPHEMVYLSDLPHIVDKYSDKKDELRNKIFICVLDYKDLYVKHEDYEKYKISRENLELFKNQKEFASKFDIEDFYKSPQDYHSVFKHYIPFISCIINGIFWQSTYYKLLKKSHIVNSFINHKPKLLAIADIACDIGGSIEILDKYTTFQDPFYVYEPILNTKVSNPDHATNEGIIYHANPKLSCSLAEDSTIQFSSMLKKYIPDIVESEYNPQPKSFNLRKSIESIKSETKNSEFKTYKEISDAIITEQGYITEKYRSFFSYNENKEITDIADEESRYQMTVKLKGHIFDNLVFKFIIDDCSLFNCYTKVVFMKVGDTNNDNSCIYAEYLSKSKEKIHEFDKHVDKILEKYNIEKSIVKSNV